MNRKKNNKGFTLIELLAVLVILTAIMGIAIPSITSSMERTKEKQNDSKKKVLTSFAELYVADHKNAIYNTLGSGSSCYIPVAKLIAEGYATEDSLKDADGNSIDGFIIFTKPSTYEFKSNKNGYSIECS